MEKKEPLLLLWGLFWISETTLKSKVSFSQFSVSLKRRSSAKIHNKCLVAYSALSKKITNNLREFCPCASSCKENKLMCAN